MHKGFADQLTTHGWSASPLQLVQTSFSYSSRVVESISPIQANLNRYSLHFPYSRLKNDNRGNWCGIELKTEKVGIFARQSH